jgi:hypothetical protein
MNVDEDGGEERLRSSSAQRFRGAEKSEIIGVEIPVVLAEDVSEFKNNSNSDSDDDDFQLNQKNKRSASSNVIESQRSIQRRKFPIEPVVSTSSAHATSGQQDAANCKVARVRGTLVVCPMSLIQHWYDELTRNIVTSRQSGSGAGSRRIRASSAACDAGPLTVAMYYGDDRTRTDLVSYDGKQSETYIN